MALTQAEMAQVMRAIEERSERLEDVLTPLTAEDVEAWDLWKRDDGTAEED